MDSSLNRFGANLSIIKSLPTPGSPIKIILNLFEFILSSSSSSDSTLFYIVFILFKNIFIEN